MLMMPMLTSFISLGRALSYSAVNRQLHDLLTCLFDESLVTRGVDVTVLFIVCRGTAQRQMQIVDAT